MPLDEDKLDLIRSWGVGLQDDGRDELRAAGRAILLLADEVDRLNVELWNTRAGAAGGPPASEPPELARTLRERLSQRLHLRTGH